jgi:hypothetical protein
MNDFQDEQLIQCLEDLGDVTPTTEAAHHALDRVRRALADTTQRVSIPCSARRRFVMRVLVTSTAASLLLVGGLAVFLVSGTPAVALADVVKAAEKHKLVKYKITETGETMDGQAIQPSVEVAYADLKAPRYRTEQFLRGHLMGAIDFKCVWVRDGKRDASLRVITETVTKEGKTDPDLIDLLKKFTDIGVPRKSYLSGKAFSDLHPASKVKNKTILENLRELEEKKGAVATKVKLDGRDTLSYRIEEGTNTTVLWVDAATKLPVRLVHEIEAVPNESRRRKYVLSEFEWDPQLKGFANVDELFSVTPPKGYTKDDNRGVRKKKEQ